jgi:hypothetical protein
MKLLYFRLLLFIIIISSARKVVAQNTNVVEMPILFTIPTIAQLDFAGSDKRITFISGKGAEQIITPSTLDKTWINYSSIVDGNSTNSISVNLSSENTLVEIRIKLDISPDAGAGAGKIGKPTSQITITGYPQEIITGIGSCFTGRGILKGHQLTYSWEWLPPYDVDHSSINNIEISVTYTITNTK